MSKRVTKTGAFYGMLAGFLVCFVMKLASNVAGIVFPVYLDPTLVGIVANIIALVIGSALTQVTDEERQERQKLFVVPESEKDPAEVKKTKMYLLGAVGLGAVVALILIVVWAIPVMTA